MARKLKAEERVGMKFINKDGCQFFVKDYVNNNNVTVKFVDEHGAEVHTSWYCCENGNVKNPYSATVYGVGCLGQGYVKGEHDKEYHLWRGMLTRCYSEKYIKSYPTYENVTVCERWLCFANFLEDLPLIENYELWLNSEEKICLDKDLKQIGVENKVYSLETVKFITANENIREANERRRGKQYKQK